MTQDGLPSLTSVLARDLTALGLPPQWRFRYVLTRRVAYAQALLRLAEHLQRECTGWRRPLYLLVRFKYELVAERMGFDIPLNVFGPGLSIAHRGTIVVNGDARVGADCRIHPGVTIGAVGGRAPVLEDGVFIGPSVGIYGPIRVGHGAVLGPHALVDRDVDAGSLVVSPRATAVRAGASPGSSQQ